MNKLMKKFNYKFIDIHEHVGKGNHPICRFNFPLPPFNETMTIERNTDKTNLNVDRYILIKEFLDSTECTLEHMLDLLHLIYEQYELAIRSSLTDSKVFLKRKPSECRVNPYIKDLINMYNANHDIQFCLNSYSVILYIVNYIQKTDRGVSLALRKIIEETQQRTIPIKDQIRVIGNVLSECTEISMKESIYILLGLSMTGISRDFFFLSSFIYPGYIYMD